MRLVFQRGKQEELLQKEIEKEGSIPKLANKLKIRSEKLKAYYYDNILLPEEVFNKFSLKNKYKKFIEDKKDNNWGRAKGGTISKGKTKEIRIPKESVELAEFYGIMLGDGNLTKIKSYKKGTYQIRIVGDSRYDKFYLMSYVKPLIEKLFNIQVVYCKSKDKNALNLVATSIKLIEFLESKGFKPGDKIRNQLEIPLWIKNNKEYLRACLRGLYDADGSAYKLTNQNSYQICFTNYNNKLLQDARNSLISLGINPSQVTKGRDILITKKSELRKFLNGVGFSNEKHFNKVKMWNI